MADAVLMFNPQSAIRIPQFPEIQLTATSRAW
jgi:hypothetical protein